MEPESNKEYCIDVLDHLGNRIVCEGERWRDHITGKRRHTDLAGMEDLVIAALQHPCTSIRYHDTDYPNRMSYYGDGSQARYIKVSVEFQASDCKGIGEIRTAHLTNNMKPLEKPEFPK
jgi:hypothetical protein